MEIVGPLQIRVLHHLWTHGPATVLAVHNALMADNLSAGRRTLAYTTVLTVMRNLVRRGILEQQAAGRAHRFTPLISREAYCQELLTHIRQEVFAGDARALLRSLAEDAALPGALREGLIALATAT
jgi:predicted transcriptional regulator